MTSGTTLSHPPPATRHRVGLAGLRARRGWELHPGVRSDDRLSVRERAADRARDGVGSWTFMALVAVLLLVAIVVAVRRDQATGSVAVLDLVLSGVALLELSLVLLAARRADRLAAEVALYDLESDRRRAAGVEELRDEVQRLRGDLARLAARLEASAGRGEEGGT